MFLSINLFLEDAHETIQILQALISIKGTMF